MQAQDPDERYVRTAVMILLVLTLFAALCATAIHWLASVHRTLDMIVPPTVCLLNTGLIIALMRRPDWALAIARIGLVVAGLALAAPAWLYTLEATLTPGVQLIAILPPVSSLFVVFLLMLMIFIPGRSAFYLAALSWVVIAWPVLGYLLLHRQEMWAPRGRDLLLAYGPASIMVVVLLPVQRAMAGKIRRLSSERNLMEVMLRTDPLTGVQSRLLGQQVLRKMLREEVPAGVIMFDLDRFKTINDTHGHPVGDRVLQAVAHGCQGLLRGGKSISRWGGEEFLVMVPNVDASGLQTVAERLRTAIAELPVAPVEQVTASLGTAMIQSGDNLETVLQRADLALYRAKQQGGNRVVAAGAASGAGPGG
ncbi:MAG TPA: GGDEF domain-containing protein [Rhodanobacteraceae bacterium]|jgi:diguanylate cyclase (GGDEF)-like protein|nr:GGDEF domain-containing protein [Rhodanobacteraceae bacterium]